MMKKGDGELIDALIYQKKHLELAGEANDLVEQQRANTQLGRTYHEMFLKSDNDQISLQNAKKCFTFAMRLAQTLRESPQSDKYTFLKEYVDAHNNIGMVDMDLGNLEEAEEVLTRGLQICDEEEVAGDDNGRARIHHNLGNVCMELGRWDKALRHIKKDIVICKNIRHCQGEAKGYINLGELHYRVQKYDEATLCYEKAMNLAKSMDDEHALLNQIKYNIETVKEATNVMEELKKEEQNHKRLTRKMVVARGTSGERKCLLQQNASLDRLIEKSSMISAWTKHFKFAKKKKKVSSELCDKEKLGDSCLVVGESYQKLRDFNKAQKWYSKSWETYKLIGNMEGQALAKINLGDVLDSVGKWANALDAFSEGYSIACRANLLSVQLSALENMHYCHMIRFDNVEEARRLQSQIDKLKQSISEHEQLNIPMDCCPETDTEGDEISLIRYDMNYSPKLHVPNSCGVEDSPGDENPLVSLRSNDNQGSQLTKPCASTRSQETRTSRKRGRLVLSDDEDEVWCPQGRVQESLQEHVASSNEFNSRHVPTSHVLEYQDLEESTASNDVRSLKSNGVFINICQKDGPVPNFDVCADEYCNHMIFRVVDDFVHIEPDSCKFGDKLSMEDVKVEVACLYFLKLTKENRSKGLLPVVQHLRCGGEVLESLDVLDTPRGHMHDKSWVEVSIDRWEPKPLLTLYVDCCDNLSEPPNLKLLRKLYNLEVSEDEMIISDCELHDISAAPLLNVLLHKTIAVLNLSHNLLGNVTMQKLNLLFMSSSQKHGGLVLDLHCNRLGPISLFQICECPVLLSCLEVLNLSGNRLTDRCAVYLSRILQNCKGLYSLNIERCSITSRTIEMLTESLHSGSVLSELFIGHNSFISGNTIVHLLDKLATLKSFSQLNLNGIKLNKSAVDSLCKLIRTSRLSGVMIGDSRIGNERAMQLMDSWNSENHKPLKLDLSSSLLTSDFIMKVNTDASLISELNLGGNALMQEGGIGLALLVKNPNCCLKVVVLSKCQLGVAGILAILEALADNTSIEELNLSENANSLDSEDDANAKCRRRLVSDAISAAKQLLLLDLSNNGFCEQVGETLYGAWSKSRARGGLRTQRHIEGNTIHLSVQPYHCCNTKPCCRMQYY